MNYDNVHCKIAAQMLKTKPDLLAPRLIKNLNQINYLMGGGLRSTEVIASAIVQWQEGKVDDFTGDSKS